MSNANELTASEAAAKIQAGELSCRGTLMKACLARVDAREADVQAWAWLDPEYALSQARARDEEQAAGKGIGPAARYARGHQGHHRYR